MDTKTFQSNAIQISTKIQSHSPLFKIHEQGKDLVHRVIMNVTLLSLTMGYSMVYFNAINFDDLILIFQLTIQKSFAQGLLTGCIPASACLGGLLSKVLLTTFSRKQCFDVMNLMCICSVIMIQTRIIPLLIMGRLIQGFLIGAGTAIVPLYIKQFIPQMNGKYGMCHQIFFISGVLLTFLLNMIFYLMKISPQTYWRWHFGFPIIISIYQNYMMHFHYNFETPRYLVSENRNQDALQLLRKIYKEEFVNQQFHILYQAVHFKKYTPQYEEEFIEQSSITKQVIEKQPIQLQDFKQNKEIQPQISTNQKEQIQQSLLKHNKPYNNPLAVFCALHVNYHQQIIGVGSVIVYSGDIIKQVFPSIFFCYAVIVHSFGFCCVVLGMSLIQKYGRVTLMQVGSALMSICMILLGVNFLRGEDRNDWVIAVTVVFIRGVFSCTMGPIAWLYMAEVVKPNIIPYGTMLNWGGATLVFFLFPIMSKFLGGPGLIFLFNAFGCILSIGINAFTLVESKDKHELTIRHEFDEKIETLKKYKFLKCFFQ